MNLIQEGNISMTCLISYVQVIAIKVKPGKYRVKAETYQGKIVSKTFTKGPYAQNLDIEF